MRAPRWARASSRERAPGERVVRCAEVTEVVLDNDLAGHACDLSIAMSGSTSASRSAQQLLAPKWAEVHTQYGQYLLASGFL
jgi:hypothetical protein